MKNPKLTSIYYCIIILIAICCSTFEVYGQLDTTRYLVGADNQQNYYKIDVSTGNATPIGTIDGPCTFRHGAVAIAYDSTSGRAFAQSPDGCFEFFEFDPSDGSLISSYSTNVVPAGLEFANGILYGSNIISGDLVRMNLNNGSSFVIGSHGITNSTSNSGVGWLNGLAYDQTNAIMYGVLGGVSSNEKLYTVDLTTGLATLVGATGVTLGSLSFGPDGKLYGGGGRTLYKGKLYEINTSTGAATLVGPTLIPDSPTITSLMLVVPPCIKPLSCKAGVVVVFLDTVGSYIIDVSDINDGSDGCGIIELSTDPDTIDCNYAGILSVKLIAKSIGNGDVRDSCIAQLMVMDSIPPNFDSALCADLTIALDSTGNATISTADINPGFTDACGIQSLLLSQDTFTCADIGTNTVTLTATDSNSNSSSCSGTVTVLDTIGTVTACKATTISLDSTGIATLDPASINGGSSNLCSPLTFDASQTIFSCNELGLNVVTLTVTDSSDKSDSCVANVVVADNMPPTVKCKDISASPDNMGNITVSVDDANNGSSDNCGIDSLYLNQYIFNCSVTDVTLIVIDSSGNKDSCIAVITYIDSLKPLANCQDIITELDSFGSATIDAATLNNGSTDNCAVTNFTANPASYSCSDLGDNPVILTVYDGAGNSDTCHASVAVLDNIAPVSLCHDINVVLDYSGSGTITVGDINNGSSDNCGPLSFSLSDSSFNCTDVGPVNVTLSVTDGSFNTSSCVSIVTVIDDVVSLVNCTNKEIFLDNSGSAYLFPSDVDLASYDNCGITDRSLSIDTFDCNFIGTDSVILTVTDINGNSASCISMVTVSDTIKPIASCKDTFKVILNSSDIVKLPGHAFNDGSNDNCGPLSFSTDKTLFTCSDIGYNTVTLTVSDGEGNTAAPCQSVVDIHEATKPTALCKSQVNLYLDGNGNAAVSPVQIDDGSFDNCTSISYTLDINILHCISNLVTMTVTDMCGNSSSCSSVVYTSDTIAPDVHCVNQVLNLDVLGQGAITTLDVDGGISDECSINSVLLSRSDFTCNDIGNNQEQLTVTDNSGNTTVCDFTVSVLDPTSSCAPACAPPANPVTNNIGLTQAVLEWDEVFEATTYTLIGREIGKDVVSINTSNTTIAVSGLKVGTGYEWSVSTNCGNGISSTNSQTVQFTTLSCNKPATIYSDNIETTSAILNWSVVPEAIGYNLIGKEIGNHSPASILLPNGNINLLFAAGIRPGKTHVWAIQSICSANPLIISPWTAADTFTTNMVQATSKTGERINPGIDWDVKVFPNPGEGLFQIVIEGEVGEIHIGVYDILRRPVYTDRMDISGLRSNVLVDLRQEDSGIYFVEIVSGVRTKLLRIVKQ